MSGPEPTNDAIDDAAQRTLRRRARVGVIALGVRSALQNLVTLGAQVYLARKLAPSDYGVFAILQFALQFFRLVGDTGLGAALVQQKSRPEERVLSTIWWLQLGSGVALVGLSFGAVPLLPFVWPSLSPGLAWLLPGLSLGLLFTMLRSVPFLMMERDVNFTVIGTLEFAGTLVFYGTAIALAASDAGVVALVAASVGQAAIISLAAYAVQPWRPKLIFDFARVKPLLRFGFAFQGHNAAGFVNGAVTPFIVGSTLGTRALGLIQFAESTALFPSVLVGIVGRVYFPYLSRLRSDRPAFARALSNAVLPCGAPAFLFFGLFAGLGPLLVPTLYGQQWQPAISSLYVYSFGFCFTFFSWIGAPALEALGEVGALLRIKVGSLFLNWIATYVATRFFPTPLAFALGFAIHLVITPAMIYVALRNLVPEARPLDGLGALVVASGVIVVAGRLALPFLHGVGGMVLGASGAVLLFAFVALMLNSRMRVAARELVARLRERRRPSGA